MPRLVLLSDTHGRHDQVDIPDGDILVFAGDLMTCGHKEWEVQAFLRWFDKWPHEHKLMIAGNHDRFLQNYPRAVDHMLDAYSDLTWYLQDGSCRIAGLKFWGSPWQPEFYNWAFNLPRGEPLKAKWNMIPNDTDVLITHGPPSGILDTVPMGMSVGCEDLKHRVREVNPKLHVFGHIHHSYGQEQNGETLFVNASICNEQYNPVNSPIIVDL